MVRNFPISVLNSDISDIKKYLYGPINITVIHINAHCIRNKMEVIDTLINNKDTTILCCTEHWLYPGEAKCFNFTHFNSLSIYCRSNSFEIAFIKQLSVELHCKITGVMTIKILLIVKGVYRLNSVYRIFKCSSIY